MHPMGMQGHACQAPSAGATHSAQLIQRCTRWHVRSPAAQLACWLPCCIPCCIPYICSPDVPIFGSTPGARPDPRLHDCRAPVHTCWALNGKCCMMGQRTQCRAVHPESSAPKAEPTCAARALNKLHQLGPDLGLAGGADWQVSNKHAVGCDVPSAPPLSQIAHAHWHQRWRPLLRLLRAARTDTRGACSNSAAGGQAGLLARAGLGRAPAPAAAAGIARDQPARAAAPAAYCGCGCAVAALGGAASGCCLPGCCTGWRCWRSGGCHQAGAARQRRGWGSWLRGRQTRRGHRRGQRRCWQRVRL